MEPQLTEDELKRIRDMIDKEKKYQWFWASLRIWAGWISATILFFYASYHFLTSQFSKGN